jgi:hypothetical protein
MTTPTKPIRLECDFEPSWIDAKTRLRVAAEFFGFPFHICMDEVPYAYKSRLDYVYERYEDENISADELKACYEWASVYMKRVDNMDEAMSILYPWFHDGAKMEDAQ